MIIDSHAHYAHTRFDVAVPYLSEQDREWVVGRSCREELLAALEKNGIVGVIEPSIGLDGIEKQLKTVSEHPAFLRAAVGVHPTRCIYTPWRKRETVKAYAEHGGIVAIGETGLDYHHPRPKQKRFRQKRWFTYQIKLADALKLPLILHIREADKDALKILSHHQRRLHGGVVHCFTGDLSLAEDYIALGFALGIGGKLLCDDEIGRVLKEVVKSVPLSSVLVETDAPFVLPDLGELCHGNQRKKLCNSSLILPNVIRKIAELRRESYEAVEEAIYQNTLRVFKLKA